MAKYFQPLLVIATLCLGVGCVSDNDTKSAVQEPRTCTLPAATLVEGCAELVPVVQSPGTIFDDLEITPDGCELQVADTLGSSVRRFAMSDGSELVPQMVEDMNLPWSLVLTPDDATLLVAEIKAGRVYRIPVPGQKTLFLENLTLPMDLGYDSLANLYVCETEGNPANFGSGWITRIALDGTRTVVVAQTPGVCDLALDQNDNLYFVGAKSDLLYRQYADASSEVIASGFTGPTDLLYDVHRNGIWVSYGADVAFVNLTSGSAQKVTCDDTLVGSEDMALDREGNLYLVDAGAGMIYRLDFAAARLR